MLTGLHPHQTGVGILTYDSGPEGYAGNLNHRCVTIPQVLKANGYRTYMSGKWHVASSLTKPTDTWPLQRGFDEFYGTIIGAGSFYDPNTLTRGNDNVENEAHAPGFFYTDAISDQAVAYIEQHAKAHAGTPFFEYVAYTAPHWPLHAHEEDIAKYKGRFDAGWDALREARLDKLVASGILKEHWKLTDRDPTQPPWSEAQADEQFRAWTLRCMEVYAAQIDRMDQGIGRILAALEQHRPARRHPGHLPRRQRRLRRRHPRGRDRRRARRQADDRAPHHAQRRAGALRQRHRPHARPGEHLPELRHRLGQPVEHAVPPLQALDPRGRHLDAADRALAERHRPQANGGIRHAPGYLPDIMATIVDATGVDVPADLRRPRRRCARRAVAAAGLRSRTAAEDRAADVLGARRQRRRAHRPVEAGASATRATGSSTTWTPTAPSCTTWPAQQPARVKEMAAQYDAWAERCGVIPREKIVALMSSQGVTRAFWEKDEA